MNAFHLRARSGPGSMAFEPATDPKPGPGEVLVRVRAAAVTPTELVWSPTWTTPSGAARAFPITPGHEFAGEVSALGEGVADLAVGDAIYGMNDWYRDGAQAELCLARPADVAAKPRTLDFVAAASVPISALTALQGLVDRARVKRGERVLVHGAAGGVGLFAVQIARSRGARVLATASSRNLDFVRELGAETALDYRAQRFEDVFRDVDVVFDTVGGDTLARSWGVLGEGGRLVTIAASSEHTRDPREQDAFFIVEPSRAQLEQIARAIDGGELRAAVGAVFPLARAREAYAHKPERGKVVLAA